jgi:hypothetical protein
MPSLDEALQFVDGDATSADGLRRACRILGLDDGGSEPELRARLHAALADATPGDEIVCLDPEESGEG